MFKKFLLVVLLVALVAPIFGYEDLPTRMEDVKLRKNTFDYLARSTYYALPTTKHAAPNDIVSTGTHTVSYQGTVDPPFLLRIQNRGTGATAGKIHFCAYSTSAAVGVLATVATDSYLETKHANFLATGTAGQLAPGEVWEKIFYQDPNITFGGTEAATFSIQIFTRPTQ